MISNGNQPHGDNSSGLETYKARTRKNKTRARLDKQQVKESLVARKKTQRSGGRQAPRRQEQTMSICCVHIEWLL